MMQSNNGSDPSQQQQQQVQQQWMPYPAATMMMQHQMMPQHYPLHFMAYPHQQPPQQHQHQQQQQQEGGSSEENKTLWVGDLHSLMDENYLNACFGHTGEVVSIKVIRNKQTNQSEGYGFVEFFSRATAEKVLQGLQWHSNAQHRTALPPELGII